MKKKELKNFAKRIAGLEYICQTSNDAQEISKAQTEIMKLTNHISHVGHIDELLEIDVLIQEILEKEYNL